ncbi:MAG: ABC transporter substrate-binding protein [Actinomycetota bacterium]
MQARRLVSLVLVLATAVIGLGGAAIAQTSSAPAEKVVFTWGGTGEPDSLNPMTGYLAVDFYFWTAAYHLLVDFDENFGVDADGGLVTDVEVGADNQTFTYTIRSGILWSDGEPLTARDVAFSLNLYKDKNAYLPSTYLGLIDGPVTAPDDTTITFRTTEPTGLYAAEAPYIYAYILPEHIWGGLEKPKGFENVPMVGSGPFVVVEYKVGEYVRLERNPYWVGDEPYVDELIYRIFKNEDALAEALKAGEVDLAYFSSSNVYNSLADEPNIERMAGTIPSFSEIGMTAGSAVAPATDTFTPHGDGHPALADVTVRRAVRMAIDSQQLVDKVLLGYGQAGDTIVPPVSVAGARWAPSGDDLISWDIDGANAMLDAAGYADCDGDGVREMPDCGQSLVFRYYVRTSEQTSVDAAEFVRPWLAEIGIDAQVEAITSAALGDLIVAGEYDLFSWGWIPDPDPDVALGWFTCDSRPPDGTEYGNNDAYYCNPEYDALYLEQRATLDPEARWAIVEEMQRIFYEDSAYAVMWYDPILQAYRTDTFEGYNPQPQPEGDLLEGYGGPSTVWTTLRPVGTAVDTGVRTRGLGAGVWVGLIAAGVAIVAVAAMRRRRAGDGDDV